ncbi:MAG: glycerol-3-phosphate 1-O-acyltransferase PlsY [Thermomicrobiales bacterium]
MASALFLVFGYIVGAIPWGVILGRWRSGTDLRDHGSGATGTTNAYRILGWRISVAVLALDYLKGLVPVLVAIVAGAGDWTIALVGVCTVLGHCWSPFIRLKGGKGVATGAGAATAIAPWALLVLPVMLVIVAIWRYVSLASLVGSLLAAAGLIVAASLGWLPWPFALAVSFIVGVIVLRHQENIARLRAGSERKIVRKPGRPSAAQPPIT